MNRQIVDQLQSLFTKRRRYIVIVAIAVIFLALFFSLLTDALREQKRAAQNTEEPAPSVELELTYAYQNAVWNAQIAQTVEAFEKENPDVHILYEPNVGNTVYENLLSRKAARNELGDIIQLKTPDAFAKGGYLCAIPQELAAEVSYAYEADGEILAIGAVETTSGILYNQSVFDAYGLQEPDTYPAFLELCEVLSENGITPVGIAGGDLWHMEYWVNHFFRTDVLAVDENWLGSCRAGTVSWTDEEPVRMLADLKELFERGYVNADWRSLRDTSLPYRMERGEIAMIYTGPWSAAGIENDEAAASIGWFCLPDAEGNIYAAKNQDTYWAVSAECGQDPEKYDAAVRFLTFFYTKENYSRVCMETMTFPVIDLEAVATEDRVRKKVRDTFLGSTEQMTSYIGNADCPQDFEEEMLLAIEAFLEDEMGAEETAVQIQEIWESKVQMEKEG